MSQQFLTAVNAGIVLLVQGLGVQPYRAIGDIQANVTVEEEGLDELTITEHPVEQGAAITDHAFKNPATCLLRVAWSNSSPLAGFDLGYAQEVYDKLLTLQESRELFTLYTGKRVYPDMLLASVHLHTDQFTENGLFIRARCQQVIITQTSLVTVSSDSAVQAQPQKTSPIVNTGAKSLQNAPNFVSP